jgi:hypothetical protein
MRVRFAIINPASNFNRVQADNHPIQAAYDLSAKRCCGA